MNTMTVDDFHAKIEYDEELDRTVECPGSSVTFEYNGRKMTLHRPHPGKEALRYRVLAVREFIQRIGIKP